jgi:hypothetical protein
VLRLILHPGLRPGLLPIQQRLPLRLTELGLLVLLAQVARPAAKRTHAVAAPAALEPVLGAHVTPVDHGQDEWDA